MKTPVLECRLFFFISSCLLLQMVAAQAPAQCLSHQKMLLLQFRSSLKFNPIYSTKLARWNHSTHDDCCVWPGVECDTSGHVVSLILDDESIRADGIHSSSALFSLQYLETLNLASNDFNFTPIPVQIYNLTNLTYLNLSNAWFGGQIPNGISRLTRLVTLDLSLNFGLKLEIPNLNQFFENSTQLRQLYLDAVDLSSTVVLPKFLANFSNLKTLSLRECNLQGSFPTEIFQIQGLQELNLELNLHLSGGFPSFPENGSLRMISVALTQFTGSLPASISNLSNLSRIDLSDCNFSGSIPSTMAQLTSLTYVDFALNKFTGSIPIFQSSKNLIHIDLSFNGLTGPLSSKHFEGLSKIEYIYLSSNLISGRIPSSLFSLSLPSLDLSHNSFDGLVDEYVNVSTSQLEWLDLSSNHLIGSIPRYFFEFPMLSHLNLSSNSLSGKIPSSLFSLPSLVNLYLSNNSFDGLVDDYVNVSYSQLESLDLSSNRLNGSFPKYFFEFPMLSHLDLSSNSLGGKIPSSMFSLPSLTDLDLSSNSFDGLVDEYVNASTSHLDRLNLSSNRLTEFCPKYFFEFPMLSDLDLSSNSLSGKIPSSMFSLSSLVNLDLSDNSFDGLVDDYVNVSDSHLVSLDLSSNSLNGFFPEYFFELPVLSELILSSNSLGGKIPSSLFSLPSLYLDLSNNSFDGLVDEYANASTSQLESLNLSSNRLNGSFLEYFFEFPMLRWLILSSNSFGEMIEFESLQKLTNLRGLDLSNNEIRGEIPSWIWELGNGTLYYLNLSCNFLESLEKPYTIPSGLGVLDLHSNQLRGPLPIPPACNDGQDGPIHLDYSHNFFNGSIPFGLGIFARNAYFLSLANNSFTGTIPESICSGSYHLVILDLSDNKLGGTLPSCLFNSFDRLGVLNLGKNQIHGTIPDSFTIYCSLQTLDLSRNSFEGKIPKSLINCSLLEVLNVGSNNIVDTFPCALKILSSLCVLVLRSNNFHGDLHCVNANHMWPNLQIIEIASNNFSGKLSPKFLNWKRMIIDEDTAQSGQYIMFNYIATIGEKSDDPFEYYHDILMVTWKGIEMEMVKILKVFTFVDFSCNNFYGVIPESIGVLTSLYALNLSHNGLTGNIPETIGNLKMIESLDLSANQLGGEIPTELAKLTFLSVLNLSFNFRLSGMIPTGNQLNTFGPDSYLGNQKLCGFPLSKSCKSPKTSNGGRSEIEFDCGPSEIKWEYLTCALGFAVGLGAYLWMLLHNKRCREAYQQLDEVLIRLFGPRQRGRKSPGPRRRVHKNRF